MPSSLCSLNISFLDMCCNNNLKKTHLSTEKTYSATRAFLRWEDWGAVIVPIKPKGVKWGWGQGSVPLSFFKSNLDIHVFMELVLCTRATRALPCWDRFKPFSSPERKSKSYKKHSIQLCAFLVATTYSCEGQQLNDVVLFVFHFI